MAAATRDHEGAVYRGPNESCEQQLDVRLRPRQCQRAASPRARQRRRLTAKPTTQEAFLAGPQDVQARADSSGRREHEAAAAERLFRSAAPSHNAVPHERPPVRSPVYER